MIDIADPNFDALEILNKFKREFKSEHTWRDFKGEELLGWINFNNSGRDDNKATYRTLLRIWIDADLIKVSAGLIGKDDCEYRYASKGVFRKFFRFLSNLTSPIFMILSIL